MLHVRALALLGVGGVLLGLMACGEEVPVIHMKDDSFFKLNGDQVNDFCMTLACREDNADTKTYVQCVHECRDGVKLGNGHLLHLPYDVLRSSCWKDKCSANRADAETVMACLGACPGVGSLSASAPIRVETESGPTPMPPASELAESASARATLCYRYAEDPSSAPALPGWFSFDGCATMGEPRFQYNGDTLVVDVPVTTGAKATAFVGLTASGADEKHHHDFPLSTISKGQTGVNVHFEAKIGGDYQELRLKVYDAVPEAKISCKGLKCESWMSPCPRRGCKEFGFVMNDDLVHDDFDVALP